MMYTEKELHEIKTSKAWILSMIERRELVKNCPWVSFVNMENGTAFIASDKTKNKIGETFRLMRGTDGNIYNCDYRKGFAYNVNPIILQRAYGDNFKVY